jgi:NADPH:quinone reductase-like Zn-dependent oxidoreductase
MKAIVINEYGDPEVSRFADHPDPVVGKGEVQFKVAAGSINPVDTFGRRAAQTA